MKRRRDFVIAATCVLSAVAAMALKPRRNVTLLAPGKKLANIVPRAFGSWISQDVSDQYAPETPDSLLAQLYGETVGRIYTRSGINAEIMMLLAHGDSQSNELQLHRPEVCYPAFGFSIAQSQPTQLDLGGGVTLPSRRLVAQSVEQKQAVIYWTRLGEYFPLSVIEQRLDRLNTAIHHYVPDGLLARFSISGSDTDASFETMQEFIAKLVSSVTNSDRAVLVGSHRASLLMA